MQTFTTEERRRWCGECQAEQEGWHRHNDPLEKMTWHQLLKLARHLSDLAKVDPARVTVNGHVSIGTVKR